ncbi:MAG TPA: D-hexose-6-phosphate mutarotase [Longimicrobium sp.]|nr:D-hexose-6-phosphate mutarotase [Longimicrobium sp.]
MGLFSRPLVAAVAVEPGEGGLHRVVLTHPRGGRARVYLHGAHLAEWRDGDGDDVLFVSAASKFDVRSAIRGGVPVVFPQFADQGPLPKHGFARTASWTLAAHGATPDEARVSLRLSDTDATRALWPHAFTAHLTVTLGDTLAVELTVENAGEAPFDFTCALHTYFRVDDVRRASVAGLRGVRYRDKVTGGEVVEAAEAVEIAGEVDRVYMGAPDALRILDPAGGRTVVLRREGFADAVVWNPGPDLARELPDLGDDEYLRMLCVEAANAASPVRLAPEERWVGRQTIEVARS